MSMITGWLQANVDTLSATVKSLNKKCEDLEARCRWNNIRLVGLPKEVKGPRPTDFVAELSQDSLELEAKPMLDRATRMLRAKSKASHHIRWSSG